MVERAQVIQVEEGNATFQGNKCYINRYNNDGMGSKKAPPSVNYMDIDYGGIFLDLDLQRSGGP